jgi:hypothetical protein
LSEIGGILESVLGRVFESITRGDLGCITDAFGSELKVYMEAYFEVHMVVS